MIRTLALAASLLAALASPVAAQSAPGGGWAFEVGAGTDNRSKAASKSGNDGYIYGSATWESADGLFYIGPGLETIQAGDSNVEAEFTAGYQPEAFGFAFDFNASYKNRLDARAGYDEDAWEFTGDVERDIGPAAVRLRLQYSPDAAGSTEAFTWVEAQAGWAFSERLQASVAVGRREQDDAPDYTGWNLGATYALTPRLDLDLRYYDTSAHADGKQYEDALVAQVAYAF